MATDEKKVEVKREDRTWDDIYTELSKEFASSVKKHSEGAKTGKGYDTTGIPYQYCVNRFNEVLGPQNWNYSSKLLERIDGTSKSGAPRIALTYEMTITVTHKDLTISKVCYGGHVSNNYADALKGAFTNSFKKTAAMFGVGRQAYEGSLDDDNKSADENAGAGVKVNKNMEVARKMVHGANDIDKLIDFDQKIKSSKLYSKEEKEELLGLIKNKLDEIQTKQESSTETKPA